MGKSKSAKSGETKKSMKAKSEKTPEQLAATAYISARRKLGKSVTKGQDDLVGMFSNFNMGKGNKSKRRRRRKGTRKK